MVQYGYIDEAGYLVSKYLEESKEFFKNEKDELCERLVTIQEQAKRLNGAEWKPVDEIDGSKMVITEETSVHLVPYDAGDRIAYRYDIEFNDYGVKKKIRELKQKLADSDYKVIKSYEASLDGEPAPYDMKSVKAERQKFRDEINRLESLKANYKG
jgi:hypothetical protein